MLDFTWIMSRPSEFVDWTCNVPLTDDHQRKYYKFEKVNKLSLFELRNLLRSAQN